jgi:hypothetical protein
VNDPWKDPDMKAWVAHAQETLVPMLGDSSMTVSLCPDAGNGDIKYAVELGLSIMMNKPIVLLARVEDDIPPKLRAVADEIVVGEIDDPYVRSRLHAAIDRIQNNL